MGMAPIGRGFGPLKIEPLNLAPFSNDLINATLPRAMLFGNAPTAQERQEEVERLAKNTPAVTRTRK